MLWRVWRVWRVYLRPQLKNRFWNYFFCEKKIIISHFRIGSKSHHPPSTLHTLHNPPPIIENLPCPSHVTPEWKSVGQRWCVKCIANVSKVITEIYAHLAIGWRLLYHCDLNIISCISPLLISNRSESTKLTYDSVHVCQIYFTPILFNVSSYVLLYFEVYFEMWWTDIVCIHGSDMGGNMGFQILCHNNTWDICMVMDECIMQPSTHPPRQPSTTVPYPSLLLCYLKCSENKIYI